MAILATVAASVGIFSNDGTGNYHYTSVRGKQVIIYGKGIYKHMSAEVAPQGIAQDYVTLFMAVPLLLISLFLTHRGSEKGKILLSGTVGYFLVTYLFYLVMGMYNQLFLVYVLLLGLAFYSFLLSIMSFNANQVVRLLNEQTPVKWIGGFLMFTSLSIAFLWLSIVVPPLMDGTIIPVQAEHYTTLIVQGLDLAVLLPGAFICGRLLFKKKPGGHLSATIYLVFLSLLMTALTAKVIAMALHGYPVVPVIFIIPSFTLASMLCTIILFKNIKHEKHVVYKYQHHANPKLAK